MTETQQVIKELRERGWSVMAIARAVGVSDATVRRWVNGTTAEPENTKAVLTLLRGLVGRRPPRRPYVRRK